MGAAVLLFYHLNRQKHAHHVLASPTARIIAGHIAATENIKTYYASPWIYVNTKAIFEMV